MKRGTAMAYDGSVRIDVGLNNDPIKRGVKEIEKELTKIEKDAERLSSKYEATNKSISEQKSIVSELKNKYSELQKESAGATTESKRSAELEKLETRFEKVLEISKKATIRYNELHEKIKAINKEGKEPSTGLQESYEKASARLKKYRAEHDELLDKKERLKQTPIFDAKELSGAKNELAKAERKLVTFESLAKALQKNIENTKSITAELRTEFEKATKLDESEIEDIKSIVQKSLNENSQKKLPVEIEPPDTQEINQVIDDVNKTIEGKEIRLTSKYEAAPLIDDISEGQADIAQSLSAIQDLYKKIYNDMVSWSERYYILIDLQKQYSADLEQAISSGDRMAETLASSNLEKTNTEIDKAKNKLEETALKADILRGELNRLEISPDNESAAEKLSNSLNRIAGDAREATTYISDLDDETSESFEKMSAEAEAAGRVVLSAFSKLGSATKKVASIVGKATSNIIGMTKNIVLLRKNSDSAASGIQRLGKRLVQIAAAAFVFNVIRRGLDALSKTMNNMLQQNAEFAASWNVIKVNLLTAFAPLWETIQPAILTFMQILAQFTSALAQFSATVFGKTYQQAMQAAQGIYEQANSVDTLGNAAKKAAKFLAPFDELITIPEKTDESAGSGLDFANIEPPTSAVVDWIDEFKQKLLEVTPDLKYFSDLGEGLGQKIADSLNKIPWKSLQKNAKSAGKKLGSLASGFLGSKSTGNTIGSTIAEALNTAVDFSGAALGSFNGEDFGESIAEAVKSFFVDFRWGDLSSVLASWVNTLFDILYGFATSTDWKLIGKSASDAINKFFRSVNWEENGVALSVFVKGILDALLTFVRKTRWREIGENIAVFLESIDWDGIAYKTFELINVAFSGITSLLTGIFGEGFLVSSAVIASAVTTLVGAIKGFMVVASINKLLEGFGLKLLEVLPKFAQIGGGVTLAVAGLAILAGAITDLIFNWDELDTKGKILKIGLAILGAAFVALGVSIALGISTATLCIGAIVALIAGAITAVVALIAHLGSQESAILSTETAQERLAEAQENTAIASENLTAAIDDQTRAKDELKRASDDITNSMDRYINAVDKAEETQRKLIEAEAAAGISGASLQEQVEKGILDYAGMNEVQREVYKAYIDNEQAQNDLINSTDGLAKAEENLVKAEENLLKAGEQVTEATKELETAKKNETTAHWDNERALAAAKGDYESYRDAVVEAYEKGELSAEEASEHIAKSMVKMSDGARKTFTEDIPDSLKSGLDPKQFETVGEETKNWFKNMGEGIANGIKSGLSGIGDWFKKTFGGVAKDTEDALEIHSPSKVFMRIGSRISDGLISGLNNIGEIGESIASKLISGVSGIKNKFVEIGGNIANGLSDGIKGVSSHVVDTAKDLGNGIVDGIKGLLGIRSPSTLARDEIGAMFGKGVAIGVEKSSSLISDALVGAVGNAQDEAEGEMQYFKQQGMSIGSALLDGLKTAYSPIMDYFVGLFADIEQLATNFKADFTLPEITVPKLSPNGIFNNSTITSIAERGRTSQSGQQAEIQAFVDELKAMRAERIATNELLRTLIDEIRNQPDINLVMDNREVGKVVRRSSRNELRRLGAVT